MSKVVEKIENNGYELRGKMIDVCEILRDTARRHKGMTVAQFLRLRKVQKAEEKQFGHKIWSE